MNILDKIINDSNFLSRIQGVGAAAPPPTPAIPPAPPQIAPVDAYNKPKTGLEGKQGGGNILDMILKLFGGGGA